MVSFIHGHPQMSSASFNDYPYGVVLICQRKSVI